ncbi:hypothetical protein JOQ06_007872 [Pogonophryne albipinna]|uniref:Uncharacterized protein n=1 Tax=Pogonophryne albipinna TaxID=1090488 RepID=A0AAD6A9Z1_9TELE|nr:hypothetical protein JOQ06_007872 [Pogonophryne albipinna]
MSDEGDKWSVEASGLYAYMTRICTLSEAAALTDNLKAHFKSQRQADTWSNMWGSVKQFCRDNNVAVPVDADVECQTPSPLAPKRKRATKPLTSLDSFLVTTTLGQRETDESGAQRSQSDTAGFQQHLYLPVLDTLINELDR